MIKTCSSWSQDQGELSSHSENGTAVFQLKHKMRGPGQLWLFEDWLAELPGKQRYISCLWPEIPVAVTNCSFLLFQSFFVLFAALLKQLLSAASTTAFWWWIEMNTEWQDIEWLCGQEGTQLFYLMSEMLNVKPEKQYQNLPAGEIGRHGNCSRNKMNLQEMRSFLVMGKN